MSDMRRFSRLVEVTGANATARFDTSLPFENGTLKDFCWHWIGGKFRYRGFNVCPAKFAFQWLVNELSPNHLIKRTCNAPDCVNPYHGEPVFDTTYKASPGCRNGHRYDADNLYRYLDGRTECKECRRARWARYRNKRKNHYNAHEQV